MRTWGFALIALTLPAAAFAGPSDGIINLCGSDFDCGYMLAAYQQNANIRALAVYGSAALCDKDLIAFARKIEKERADMNTLIAGWHTCACGGAPCASTDIYDACKQRLSGACDFDRLWVESMMALMAQSRDDARLASTRACSADLRGQAATTNKASGNEIGAFRRWLREGYLTNRDENRACGLNPSLPICRQ